MQADVGTQMFEKMPSVLVISGESEVRWVILLTVDAQALRWSRSCNKRHNRVCVTQNLLLLGLVKDVGDI